MESLTSTPRQLVSASNVDMAAFIALKKATALNAIVGCTWIKTTSFAATNLLTIQTVQWGTTNPLQGSAQCAKKDAKNVGNGTSVKVASMGTIWLGGTTRV